MSETNPAKSDTQRELQEIHLRLAQLRTRIKTEQDKTVVSNLRAEVGKLANLLADFAQALGDKEDQLEKAALVWPRDLNTKPNTNGGWGADPTEVAGE